MRIRRLVAAIGAATLIASGITLATAPAASAAEIVIDVSCSQMQIGGQAQPIAVQPGDRIIIDFGDAQGLCGNFYVYATTNPDYTGLFEDGFPDGRGELIDTRPAYIWDVESRTAGVFGGPDEFVLQVDADAARCGPLNNTTCGAEFYLIIGSSIATGDAVLPPWFQSYARASQDEECKPGWNPSWDYWPNGGTGGWVCNRSVPFASTLSQP